MTGVFASIHVNNYLGLLVLMVVWIVLFECAHVGVMFLRREPLIGWAIGPLGVNLVLLHQPSVLFLWLNVCCPALVSGVVLYCGLFTTLSPVTLPHYPLMEVVVIGIGILITSTNDLVHALQDLRHPLWGEARVLRSIQALRATWSKIHFTPYGHSYLLDHFDAHPNDLLQAL